MKKCMLALMVPLSLVILLGLLTPAWGQEVTAAVVGTITDSTGAPIGGAKVTATDTDRGTIWTATTNDTGAYSLLRLPVGNYSVKVAASGFQSSQQSGLVLVLNQTARVDMQLKVGQVSETVEVTGAAPVLQTQSTEVSTLIDANTNVSLPLASRNGPRKAPDFGSNALMRPCSVLFVMRSALLMGPKSSGAIAMPHGECSGPCTAKWLFKTPAGVKESTKPPCALFNAV